MLDMPKILQRLQEESGFLAANVQMAKELQPSLLESEDALFLGFKSLDAQQEVTPDTSGLELEGMNCFSRLILASIIIQIVTNPTDLTDRISAVYKAMQGWVYDDVYDRGLSTFVLQSSGVSDIQNNRVLYLFEFAISLPMQ